MRNIIKKILKESEWFEKSEFQKKLKGHVLIVKSEATGAKFFVGEDGSGELMLQGFVDNVFERADEGDTPKILKKTELKKIISQLKKRRPYHIFGDKYETIEI